jgi:adenylate kinase family enzyme
MVDRIAVQGASGSGKTTLATVLAERLGLPRTELDALFHQPGWTRLATDEFRRRVAEVTAGDRWVVDGNYSEVRDLVWPRAELVVVLDLPRRVVMRQLVGRSVRRAALGHELWNGNRESFRNLLSVDEQRNVVLWSWRTHHRYRDEVPAALRTQAPHARLEVVHDLDAADRLVEELARDRG